MLRQAAAGKDRPRCTYCGAAMSRKVGQPGSPPQMRGGELTYPFTQDHIVAKARGGTDAVKNRTPCCGPCNGAKADLDLVAFIQQLGPRAVLTAGQAQEMQDEAQHACHTFNDTKPSYQLTCATPKLCAQHGCNRQPRCAGGNHG
jgi:hypothetical protein